MAKSKIIKDIANGTTDTQTALKRTKVLLQELNDSDLLQWINYEIEGYPDGAVLPQYRIIDGQLYGSYIKGSMAAHMKYSNVPIPLGKFPDEVKRKILTSEITQGISALKTILEDNKNNDQGGLMKPIPAEWYSQIALANNDPYMILSSAYVLLNMPEIMNIFPKVENKLLDILSYLENQFGNLDDLDIDIDSKSDEEIKAITNEIYVLIYNDKSITLGDNNKIKDAEIASSIK